MEIEKNMMESLFVNVFSSTVCDVILQEQKDKHVNETHQLPCLKGKLVDSALLCIWSIDEKQIHQTQRMKLFLVTYQSGVGLARKVLHGLQPLERNKDEYIQVGSWRKKISFKLWKNKVFHKITINLYYN